MPNPRVSDAKLDSETRAFAEFLAGFCASAGFRVGDVLTSGNITDGPGWIFEATVERGVTFNVEVAGPPYESAPPCALQT
jgi:hypothetical protein